MFSTILMMNNVLVHLGIFQHNLGIFQYTLAFFENHHWHWEVGTLVAVTCVNSWA